MVMLRGYVNLTTWQVYAKAVNTLPTGKLCMLFSRVLIFSNSFFFSKNSFMNTIRLSNSLDSDQA